MRKCLHCPHEGPDDTFTFYKDVKGNRRPRNLCLKCNRLEASLRQAKYREKHGDQIREADRNRKHDRYHSDPEFRQRCIDEATKRNRHERTKTSHPR